MNTNRLLAAVLVLQVVTLAGQWGGKPGFVNEAVADLPPDPGAQRVAQTEALKQVSAKLDRMITLMEGGRLKVEVTNFPKDNGKK
jgi:hypothetical protein